MGLDEQRAFAAAVASTTGAPASATFVVGVVDTVSARRQLLSSSSATVSFTIVTQQPSVAATARTGVSALAADPGTFVSALNAALAAVPGCTIPALSASDLTVAAPVVQTSAVASINVTSVGVDVVAASAAVSATFANLSASDAKVQQQAYLISLASGTTAGGNMSASTAQTAVSLVHSIVTAANVTLSDASQSAALGILQQAAATPLNVSSTMAQDVVSVLALVASSAATLASNGTSSLNALQAVTGVVNTLTGSQAAALKNALDALPPGAPPPEPAVTSTPTIQTRVQIDPPGSSRLTTSPLTVAGSPSSFEPMPAGLLPSASPVVTTFMSLAFDPYGGGGNGTAALATTGLTRLAFSNPDGSAIEVANASSPIKFTLPRVNTSGDAQAQCSFWDVAAQAYATHGCVGIPSPAPPAHNLSWVPGFTAANDSALVYAWDISGPLLAGCRMAVLDCNDAAAGKVYPDPRNPLTVSAVACPPRLNGTNATQPVLRVYFGTACALWQPGNVLNCSWDAVKQAFIGGGCVPSGDATQCMCRHLTDFASARVPKVATCSLSDMTSLSPGDIITKLKARRARARAV